MLKALKRDWRRGCVGKRAGKDPRRIDAKVNDVWEEEDGSELEEEGGFGLLRSRRRTAAGRRKPSKVLQAGDEVQARAEEPDNADEGR